MKRPNVYLVGFMGTGKTTIGRELARSLGRKFIDIDQELEKKFGQTVAQVFVNLGEAAFRAGEEEVALELSKSNNRVIATGGGTILNPKILQAFQNRLGAYKLSKATIQFPWNTPLPRELVTEIIRYAVRLNQDQKALKDTAKRRKP